MQPSHQTKTLLEIMQHLRHPQKGCAWDLQQNLKTIAPYIIEEAYETVEAIESGNAKEICNELGDLLLQVVFCSQLAKEKKWFEYKDVVYSICEKMIRRHPHVFGNEKNLTPEEIKENWEKIKKQERSNNTNKTSLLDGIPIGLAALSVALKLQKKAAKVGFDWQTSEPIIEKIKEELNELVIEIKNDKKEKIQEEIGDLLFTIVNLARHFNIEPEQALRTSNRKFKKRFEFIEKTLGQDIENASLETMDELWKKSKKFEEK